MSDENKNQVADDMLQSFMGVFNQKAEDVTFKQEEESGGVFFNPDARTANQQTWRGLVKFLPNLKNQDSMTVTKIQHWVPEGSSGFMVDSPKSLGKSENCPVSNAYFELKNSDDAQDKAKANKIRYYRKTFALIQIIKDLQNPENNGKIMLWNLPLAIQNKISAIMYPTKEDIDMGAKQSNVFDPINGYAMNLKITIDVKDGNEYRNYDSCEFVDKKIPMILDGQQEPLVVSDDAAELQKQQKAMIDTILGGPDLNDFAYKAATSEFQTRVSNALAALKGLTISDADVKQPVSEKPAEDAPKTDAQRPGTATDEKPAEDAPKTENATTSTEMDEADQILKDLNIGNDI